MTKEAASSAWVKPTVDFLKKVNQAKWLNSLWNASVKLHKEAPLYAKIPLYGIETAGGLYIGRKLGMNEMIGAHLTPYPEGIANVTILPVKRGISEVGAEATRAVNNVSGAVAKQAEPISKAVGKIADPVHGAAAKVGKSFGSGITEAARGAVAAGIGAGAVGLPTTILTAKFLPQKKHQALRNILNTIGIASGGALGLYVNGLLQSRDV
jgi:hypothetical protein